MPTFQHLLDELNKLPQPEKQVEFIDSFRKQKIKEIKEITKRDVLVYFSDLKKNHPAGAITWDDKTCFADIVEGLDKKGVAITPQNTKTRSRYLKNFPIPPVIFWNLN